MVKRIYVICLLLAAPVSADTEHTRYVDAAPMMRITIDANGLYSNAISSDESATSCRDFVLSVNDVTEFFASATGVTERAYSHDLDGSNCHSHGTFTDSKGGKGKWKIDRARRGMIETSTGNILYYHCEACTSSAYYKPCGIKCTHGQ